MRKVIVLLVLLAGLIITVSNGYMLLALPILAAVMINCAAIIADAIEEDEEDYEL